MISKKAAMNATNHFNTHIFNSITDIDHLIKLHSAIGQDSMEVFILRDKYFKFRETLVKKGFYVQKSDFASMDSCTVLFVSWGMRF